MRDEVGNGTGLLRVLPGARAIARGVQGDFLAGRGISRLLSFAGLQRRGLAALFFACGAV